MKPATSDASFDTSRSFSMTAENRGSYGSWWLLVFVAAATFWGIHIERPVDLPGWHEIDYSSIARNFLREGNNILYPRIDWRRNGPGFTEMEFPIIPWVVAQFYCLFGVHEVIGRIISLTAMLGSLWVFRGLAIKFLPEPAALAASLFFVVNHEITIVATAIQPESLMLLCYLLALYHYVDWYESKRWTSYSIALVSFAFAVLIKSPAAHLAIFFLIWAVLHEGPGAFRKPSLYLFAALSFAPALFWYAHAASLWHQFHNSMGISNEDHWIGLDLLQRPKVLANFFAIELLFVFGLGGVLVAIADIVKHTFKSSLNRLALSWCLAGAIYLLVILRTSAFYWAAYYHVVAVAPIALLFGAGVNLLQAEGVLSWRKLALWIAAPAGLLAAGLLWIGNQTGAPLPGVFQDLAIAHTSVPVLFLLVLVAFGLTILSFSMRASKSNIATANPTLNPSSKPAFSWTALIVVIGCYSYFFVSGQLLIGTWTLFSARSLQFDSVACLRGKIPANTLIVASGGPCSDGRGHRAANDAPNMFYWLDRKGFSTCEGELTIGDLQSDVRQGARYLIADRSSFVRQPGLESELRRSYRLVAECKAALLFNLTVQ